MKTLNRILAPLALTLLLPLTPLAGQQTPPDEAELTSFAETYADVQEIRVDAELRIATATNEAEAAAIQQEINEQMTEALEENNFTIERYTEITNILNNDEDLRTRFQEIYEEILEERDPTA